MTHHDAGSYAAKHPTESIDPHIAEAVKAGTVRGEFSCSQAEKVALKMQVAMEKVGATLDLLEIRIARCQLGLFGHEPEGRIVKRAASVSPEMEKAVRQALVDDRLPCAAAWSIAQRFALPRPDVASACEALEIKIKPCQLGAF